jgi:glycosyltransferase involved in cell wall biosynthesis
MISIVMAYHNRRQLLLNTLNSIRYNNPGKNDFEIIIVDDGSDKPHEIHDLPKLFPEMKLYTIRLNPKIRNHINPCITYNTAFNFISGNVVLFQNTECLHVGDILSVVRSQVKKGIHLSFAVYSVNMYLQNNINKLPVYDRYSIKRAISPMIGFREKWKDGDVCWYNHSSFRRAYGSFIWAMTRADLEDMNGFDERYAHGFAYDDAEFTIRLAKKKMIIKYSDDPFTIHQYHKPSDYNKMHKEVEINKNLYFNFTMKEPGYRARYNNFYKPSKP